MADEHKKQYWLHRVTGGENGWLLSYPLLYNHGIMSIGWSFISNPEMVKEIKGSGISRRDKTTIVPTGAYALNMLGLSTQVPANAVFYTTGSTRRVPIGEGKGIQFLHTSSAKKFAFNSRLMMLIVSAMRDIGKDQLSEEQISVIKKHLANVPSEDFNHDIQLAPMWVRKILLSL